VTAAPFSDLNSGYVLRALDRLPMQGSKEPWRLRQNYVVDRRSIRRAPIDDGAMRFSGRPARTAEASDRVAA
jgi:monooxygenase